MRRETLLSRGQHRQSRTALGESRAALLRGAESVNLKRTAHKLHPDYLYPDYFYLELGPSLAQDRAFPRHGPDPVAAHLASPPPAIFCGRRSARTRRDESR